MSGSVRISVFRSARFSDGASQKFGILTVKLFLVIVKDMRGILSELCPALFWLNKKEFLENPGFGEPV